jgi:hypothetical protein
LVDVKNSSNPSNLSAPTPIYHEFDENSTSNSSCPYSICGKDTAEYSDYPDWRFYDPTCTGYCYWIYTSGQWCGYYYAELCDTCREGICCPYSTCGKFIDRYKDFPDWRFMDPTCTGLCYWDDDFVCGYEDTTYCPTGCVSGTEGRGACSSVCGKDTAEYSDYPDWRFYDPTCTGYCYWIDMIGYSSAEYCDYGCEESSCKAECTTDADCPGDYCDDWGGWTCKDIDTKKRTRTCYDYYCSAGECKVTTKTETQEEDCPAGYECENGECVVPPECVVDADCPSDYCDDWGGWTCYDWNTRMRTRTCYDYYCSAGKCEVSPWTDVKYEDCASGYECEGGVCVEMFGKISGYIRDVRGNSIEGALVLWQVDS